MKTSKSFLPVLVLSVFSFLAQAQTVTDIDGNVYPTVSIGTQTWMAENLKTTRFANGSLIGTTMGFTNNDTSAIYQWVYNNDTALLPDYGRLYSWYAAVDSRNICPAGWHVPSLAEWDTLRAFLGDSLAGSQLKEAGTAYWISTDSTVANTVGFNARGNGFKGNPRGYKNLREIAYFWASTQFGLGGFSRGHTMKLMHNSPVLETGVAVGNCGMCIRCIQNKTVGLDPAFRQNEIDIYPNPTGGRLYIDFPSLQAGTVSIFDLSGREVCRERFDEQSSLELDSRQSTGIYLLMIRTKEGIIQKRLVIL